MLAEIYVYGCLDYDEKSAKGPEKLKVQKGNIRFYKQKLHYSRFAI